MNSGRADHPRACGENEVAALPPSARLGSPPRMRGKPFTLRSSSGAQRITPAHAGKTQNSTNRLRSTADPPRACGENLGFPSLWIAKQGSPPRMRGKLYALQSRGENRGITPACAGKAETDDELRERI